VFIPGILRTLFLPSVCTNKVKKSKQVLLLLFILIFPSAFYVYLTAGKEKSFVRLPYYGPKHPFVVVKNGKHINDSIYYSIPDFGFKNQVGQSISAQLLKGKIWVCCFEDLKDMKTTPSQTVLMNRIESRTDLDTALRMITFALDSENITSLSTYANKVHAGKRQWFLEADSGKMAVFAQQAFYAPVDTSWKNGYIHFFLLDKDGSIRGIYNGLHIKDIDALIDNISELEMAYSVKANREKAEKDDDGI
jgi:protein SCO1